MSFFVGTNETVCYIWLHTGVSIAGFHCHAQYSGFISFGNCRIVADVIVYIFPH